MNSFKQHILSINEVALSAAWHCYAHREKKLHQIMTQSFVDQNKPVNIHFKSEITFVAGVKDLSCVTNNKHSSY